MDIGKKLYVRNRKEWRSWLKKHHNKKKEIWLVYYKKGSGKVRIPYNDSVEEALCFGWIDSTLKPIDEKRYAQRFSPRRKGSPWSAMNRERIRRLIRQKLMSPAALEAYREAHPKHGSGDKKKTTEEIPSDILKALKKDPIVWKHFQKFPASYRRIRIGWIDGGRRRAGVFRQRLNYFLRMTAKNKRFGMVQ